MDITKIFEILSKHIIEIEEKVQYREIEIENLKRKIERLENTEKWVKNEEEKMKKKYKIKWNNVIAAILLIDVIRVALTLINPATSLTMFGAMIMMGELIFIGRLADEI